MSRPLAEVRRLVLGCNAPTERAPGRPADAAATTAARSRPALAASCLPTATSAARPIAALAAFDDPATPAQIVQHYPSFTDTEKAAAIATLSARPSYAVALLDAIEKGTIPPPRRVGLCRPATPGPEGPAVPALAWTRSGGRSKLTSQEKKLQIAQYKAMLTPDMLQAADFSAGRPVFAKNCATCHRLFDDGAKVGPDLTGSQRANLDYVLENIRGPERPGAPRIPDDAVRADQRPKSWTGS